MVLRGLDASFARGLRIGGGLAASAFVLAVTFGGYSQVHGWGPVAPVVASLVVFSASAQFTLAAALIGGGGAASAVLAATLVQLRFLPMALAAGPSLHGGRMQRALEGQAVNDGSWVAAHLGEGRFDRGVLFGATLAQWPAWVAGTALGVLVAPPPDLVDTLGLDVVFPAFFLLLLLDEARRSAIARTVACGGGAVAAVALLWAPAGPALIAGGLVALVGLRRGA